MKTSLPPKISSPDPSVPKPSKPPDFCPDCLGGSFWRPHRSDLWFCDACRAPATDALVAERHPPKPSVEVSELIVMAGAPVCRNCGGAWYVERWEGTDGIGSATLTCWTCRHPVTGEIQRDLVRKPKRGGLCRKRDEL